MTLDDICARTTTPDFAHKRRVVAVQSIIHGLCVGAVPAGRAIYALEHAGLSNEAARTLVQSAQKNLKGVTP